MRADVNIKKKTATQEISGWLATVGADAPLQHSNPASLYLASLQGSEASRTTARSVMKQIAVMCDQTPDTFPWHRLDRATVLALMEKLKQKACLTILGISTYRSLKASLGKPCCTSK